MRQPKTERLQLLVTKEERAEMERVAANERMTVSEYLRAAVLMYMALSGSKFAWKLMGSGLAALVREKVSQFEELETERERVR